VGDFDRISSFVRLCSWGTRATQKAAITRKGAGPISLLLLGDNCRLKFFTRQYGSKDCRIFFLFCCLIVTSVSAFGGPTPISYSLSKNYTFSTTANVQPTLNEMRYASANVNATVTALAAKTATGTLIVSGSIILNSGRSVNGKRQRHRFERIGNRCRRHGDQQSERTSRNRIDPGQDWSC